ncbi:MAG: hypothetical protein QG641_1081 [Candidatus Poribacteria bacterium]|nr:hypothetical protein [Candidatus Poribacteria bacterium]
MTELIINLTDTDYERLEEAAKRAGTSIQILIHEWIANLSEIDKPFDVTQDPVFQMEGYESEAPIDLSVNIDKYLY